MKTKFALLLLFVGLGINQLRAQSIFDKVDNLINKADRAGNTADRASKTGDKVAGVFGKKKKAENSNVNTKEASAVSKTLITISNAPLDAINDLKSSIESVKGVESVQSKFNKSKSTITVNHEGSTEDLYKKLQKTNKSAFSDKNVTELEEGVISLKF